MAAAPFLQGVKAHLRTPFPAAAASSPGAAVHLNPQRELRESYLVPRRARCQVSRGFSEERETAPRRSDPARTERLRRLAEHPLKASRMFHLTQWLRRAHLLGDGPGCQLPPAQKCPEARTELRNKTGTLTCTEPGIIAHTGSVPWGSDSTASAFLCNLTSSPAKQAQQSGTRMSVHQASG